MSCSDGWYNYPKNYFDKDAVIPTCPDCGTEVDGDGDALMGCNWSPVMCKTCGDAPCDGSC